MQAEQITAAWISILTGGHGGGGNMELSKVVCHAEAGAVDRIVNCMRGCNRSQPHLDLLKSANAVLAHMARYQQLHSALLASPDCVHAIVEQLQMFRDKEVSQC